jgi:hypothetical protein
MSCQGQPIHWGVEMTTEESELGRLTAEARKLVIAVEGLNRDAGNKLVDLTVSDRRNRRVQWALVLSYLAHVGLTVALIFAFNGLSGNTSAINEVQKVAQRDALCPLFQIFIDARSEEGKARSTLTPEEYDRAYDNIQNGYDAMKCAQFKMP